ncbi:MAG: carboxypeptidase regulatory-like domain-containing protein [Planctomycetota bacterium]
MRRALVPAFLLLAIAAGVLLSGPATVAPSSPAANAARPAPEPPRAALGLPRAAGAELPAAAAVDSAAPARLASGALAALASAQVAALRTGSGPAGLRWIDGPREGEDLAALDPDGAPRGLEELPPGRRREGPEVQVTRGGRAQAGARIRAYTRGQLGGFPLSEARTDAAGRARLPAAVSAQAGVTVVARHGDLLAVGDLGADPAPNAPPPVLSLSLSELPRLVPGWPGAPGAGRALLEVRGDEDQPCAGAKVTLLLGQQPLVEGASDAEGRLCAELPASPGLDRLTVVVSADGLEPTRLTLGALRRRGEDAERLRLRLRAGGRGGLAGLVLDAAGNPLPGAQVRALRDGDTPVELAADAAGRFHAAGLAPGLVSLEAYGEAEVPMALGSAWVRAGVEAQVTLRLRRLTELQVCVEGREPVVGARVAVVDPTVTRYGAWEQSRVESEARTGEGGLARFALPPGRYYLRAWDTDERRMALGWAEVRPGHAARAHLSLRRQRRLQVKVVDRQGNPVPGVFMDASAPGIAWRDMPARTTSMEGVADFDQLPPGRVELHIGRGMGGDGEQWRMVVTERDSATFVWTPPATRPLRGRLEHRGRALLVVTLGDVAKTCEVLAPEGALDQEVTAPDGEWEVYLLPPRRDLAPMRVKVEGGALTPAAKAFARGGAVTGRLRARGQPVPGTLLVAGRLGAVVEARAQWLGRTANDEWITVNEWHQASAPDGRFSLEGLPAGEHTLELAGIGAGKRSLKVVVAAGETTDLGDVELD